MKYSNRKLFAEWEEQSILQLAMPHENSDWRPYLKESLKTFSKIANIVSKYQKVLILYSHKSDLKYLKINKNIILKNITTNDTWCRDFGAISLKNGDKIDLINFSFNGWGLKYPSNLDNQTNIKIGFKNRVITQNMILEGGSIDFNGKNRLITTTTCLLEKNRNPELNKKLLDKKLKKIFNLKDIIWIKNGFLEGDDTDSHIDMLARFVGENHIVYQSCNDKNDIHYKALKDMEKELKQTNCKLTKLPWIDAIYDEDNNRLPASYANFLITNRVIIVPTYKSKNDKKSINIFKKIFSDREVVGIDSTTLIKQHGSIHCISMNYPKGVEILT